MTSDAGERTSLAWVRTALGLAGCALLMVRLARAPWAVGAALAAVLLTVGVLGWSHDRYRRGVGGPVAVPALVLTGAVLTVGALALLLIALR